MPAKVSPASSVTVRFSTPGLGLALSELSDAWFTGSLARISFMNRAYGRDERPGDTIGRDTGIMPTAIQARAPATSAVSDVETSAQRPSVVAIAAPAPFRPRRKVPAMLVLARGLPKTAPVSRAAASHGI